MAIEFNSSVNRYQAVSGYAQTAKTAAASPDQESAKKAAEAGAAQGKPEQAPDSVELSDDAKSVNKMSKEERAALVKSLKDDLDNQMNRFINMMTQTFQKQGMTVKSAQDDSFWQPDRGPGDQAGRPGGHL